MATICDRCSAQNSNQVKVEKLGKIRVGNSIVAINKDICAMCLYFFYKEITEFFKPEIEGEASK